MVVSANRLASEAGAEMLRAGGNAVDAAVAIGYALAVVDPCCGNIGGGGFMTLHLADGRDVFVNFRETARRTPRRRTCISTPQGNVHPGASLFGWRAVGVPGTVLGLDTALREYGTMPRARVMAPAIRLAREGFVVGARQCRPDRAASPVICAPIRRRARVFFHPDGAPLAPSDRLVQPALADTLAAIAARGPDAFYRGAHPRGGGGGGARSRRASSPRRISRTTR